MLSRSYQFLLIVLGLAALSGFLFARLPFRLGLDIKGGSRLIYEVDKSKLEKNGPPLSRVMAQEQIILDRRLSGAGGATESVIQQKGEDQFIIEIPGVIDLETARKEIGTTASLEVYHARNVVTEIQDKRPYRVEKKEGPNQTPLVTFYDQLAEKEITPADKEAYKKIIDGWDLILKGTDLKEAKVQQGAGGGYQPSFEFSSEGARKLKAWCEKYKDDQENIAEVLDGVVLAIAPLKKGTVLSDNAFIDGQFDPAYVRELVDLLNSGALPVKLNELSAQQVDPVVGTHALDMIVKAGAISFAVIAAFMIIYYVFPGIIAVVALILYTLFTLTVLKSINATFSLASIAGFVLSVGMAVDANILVFERVKEEMRLGKPLENAIEIGFKRALSAIVDSNTCTILTSLVLAYLGTGPVKGFATTLIIGVLISLFTAVTVTRSLLMFLVSSGFGANPNLYGLKRQWFGESFERDAHKKPLQIVNKCGRYFVISLITIVPGALFWLNGGLKKNVEFQGGYQVEMAAPEGLTSNQIVANLEKAGLRGSNVQFMEGASNQRLVSVTVPRVESLKNDPSPQTTIAKDAGLEGAQIKAFSSVGETIRAETVWNAVLGVIIAAALIVVYLAIRFGVAVGGFVTGLRFSLSAIGAMLHDILVVIGIAAIAGGLWGWEISALFITAVLTMIGFSTHDTIVIFDRIRENLRRPHPNEDFANLVNRSITQSFARSLNTSGTVVATLVILILAGSATMDLKFFNLAMLVGIISGTYSSIYNAAPILYLWDKAIVKRKGIQASLMTISEKEILHTRNTVSTVATPKADAAGEDKAKAYGQVKRRRASAVERSQKNIDDDL